MVFRLKPFALLVAVTNFIGAVKATGVCDAAECANVNGGTPPAYYICRQALVDEAFTSDIASTFPDMGAIQDVCKGFCYDGSRADSINGTVWDVCSGCDAEVVNTICGFCDDGVGAEYNDVGVCSGPHHQNAECTFVSGDGQGSAEEYIGYFDLIDLDAAKESCFDLVRSDRPNANGATLDLTNGDCYAEYEVAGPPTVDTDYQTCAFVILATTTPEPPTTTLGTTSPEPQTTTLDPLVTEGGGVGNSDGGGAVGNSDGGASGSSDGSGSGGDPDFRGDNGNGDGGNGGTGGNGGAGGGNGGTGGGTGNRGSNAFFGKHGGGEKGHKDKKGHKGTKAAKGDKGEKGKETGKKGKLGFLAETKNVVGLSMGGLVVLVAATAFVVQRRRQLSVDFEDESEKLLSTVAEHTPLMDSDQFNNAHTFSLEEVPPRMC